VSLGRSDDLTVDKWPYRELDGFGSDDVRKQFAAIHPQTVGGWVERFHRGGTLYEYGAKVVSKDLETVVHYSAETAHPFGVCVNFAVAA
jgi:hypothetical protein